MINIKLLSFYLTRKASDAARAAEKLSRQTESSPLQEEGFGLYYNG